MLTRLTRPEIMLARGHHALSCRSLQARMDKSASPRMYSCQRWALAGALWARQSWGGRSLTLSADVLLGTLRLSSHPWAFEGVLKKFHFVESARIYLGPLGELQSPSLLPPEEHYRVSPRFESLASQLGVAMTLPWVKGAAPRSGQTEGMTVSRTRSELPRSSRAWWAALGTRLDACLNEFWSRNEAAQQEVATSRYFRPVVEQIALVTAYASLLCACAAAAASLLVKGCVTALGALVGVAAGTLLQTLHLAHLRADENLALQGVEDFAELHYERPILSSEEKCALAEKISKERFEFIGRAIWKARTRAPDGGLEALREQPAVALAAKFREWLGADSILSTEERQALTYFFSSDEGMLPYIWLGRQTKENCGTHITQYAWQRFIECLARREPQTWQTLVATQMKGPSKAQDAPPDDRRLEPAGL